VRKFEPTPNEELFLLVGLPVICLISLFSCLFLVTTPWLVTVLSGISSTSGALYLLDWLRRNKV
jgi:hypothetical protein